MSQPEKMLYDNRIKRKNVLALNEKVAAIREFEKTPVYKHVGRSFHCSPDQIKRIIQQKDEILKAWEQRTRRCNEVKSLEMKSVRVSMLGKSVYEWIRRMMYYKDFIITDGLIQKMALQFKSALGIQMFFPHQDWCDKFRQMYKITDNDTKKLKIAYTEGHSVQIKDIIRDILGTCTPNNDEVATRNTTDEIADDDDEESNDEDDDDSGDSETEIKEEKCESPELQSKQQVAKKHIGPLVRLPPPLTPTTAALSQKRHLVTMQLPIGMQRNGATISQKVLVATPITPGATGPGKAPMTMTIIPLASVAQTINCPRPQLPTEEKPILPTPKVEIKREIVEEETVCIKKECISDDEEEMKAEKNYSEHEKENSNIKSPVPAKRSKNNTTENNPMDAELSEEEDNLALAQLQKGLANKSKVTTTPPPNNNTWMTAIPLQISNDTDRNSNTPQQEQHPSLPAMPPLTRAPKAIATSSSLPSPATALVPSTRRRNANHHNSPILPPIRTCAEARKYLKLLEDFALVRENFRLIGLITRADEVLRELDGDEDVDIE